MIFGSPALLLLARIKFKGAVRKQLRRFKRPSGWIFGLLGLLLFVGWVSTLLFGRSLRGPIDFDPDAQLLAVQLMLFVMVGMTFFGALNHRGLYLPTEEIERLFSAPVSRSDLIRFRLVTNLSRSLFAGLIFGFLSFGRLPSKLYGFLGVLLFMLTLPILGQVCSLFFGDAENRLGRVLSGRTSKMIYIVLGVGLWLGIMYLVFADMSFLELDTNTISPLERARMWLESPWVSGMLAPVTPWARMITAQDAAGFVPWFALGLVTWLVLFEVTARIPIDYRELSLQTSADVARRVNRMRRGGFGAGVGRASKRTAGWHVPWLFGRGAFGAISWLKLGAILRKARGTIFVSMFVVGGLTVGFSLVLKGDGTETATEVLVGSIAIAVLGTFYLCAGLRFDFRSDFDQMETIKSWPVRPSRVFLATLLPEVLFVSLVLSIAIAIRAVILGAFHPGLIGLVLALPAVILAWVSLDNAVFLFAPIRYVPGQEGALHHMGRSLVLMLLRMLLLLIVCVLAGAPALLVFYAVTEWGSGSEEVALTLALVTAGMVLFVVDAALVWLGGRLFQRFDVARART